MSKGTGSVGASPPHLGQCAFRPWRGFPETIQGHHLPLGLPQRPPQPGCLRFQSQEAITEYKKVVGRPAGLAELSVFYVESCAKLLGYCRIDDAGYFTALVRTFEQALVEIQKLEPEQQTLFVERLERVVHEGQDWPWDMGYDIAGLMVEYGFFEGE